MPSSGSSSSTDATYTVTLDGTATSNFLSNISSSATVNDAATQVLASFQGLSDGAHVLRLTMHNPVESDTLANSTSITGPIIVFDRAVVEMGAGVPR